MRNEIPEFRHLPRLPKSVLLIAAAIALGLSAGCGSGDGTSTEDDAAAQPGASAAASGAALPDNFPAEFPLPPNLQVTQGTFTEGSSTTQANFLVRGTSAMSVEEIASFYRARLPEAGYDVQQAQPVSAGATSALIYFHGDRFKDASVQLTSSDGATDVLISLPLRD